MALIRSILFAILFYGASVPIVVFGALVSPFSPHLVKSTARCWARVFMFLVRNVLAIEVVVKGTIPQHAVLVASKHQSAFETIAALYFFDNPAVVAKAELMKIPLWGTIAAAHGVIPVERQTAASAMRKMMRAAEAAVAADRPIIIFPEGSRVPYGSAPPLMPGLAGLYRTIKLPIVPVALDSGRVWPRRKFVKQPGRITLAFGDPIPAGLDRKTIETRVHEAINRVPA